MDSNLWHPFILAHYMISYTIEIILTVMSIARAEYSHEVEQV